ncbi:putative abc-2 type transport system permease protein [hydrocarbon metagenome]|uniref:Putative abc-2 type transport system permease protein n=1 Tax=hydrocarbon metagenome TaxID=938273 RepID=A0A0W8E456_9ZZZZ
MTLFTKELNDLKARFLILFLLIGISGYLIIVYYGFFISLMDLSTIEEYLALSPLSRYLDPASLMQQLGLLLNNIDFYVWSQWFGKNLYQFMILSSIVLAFSSFAREAEHNTMSFLLSNFTRWQIFTSKVLAGSILLMLLVAEGCFVPFILAPAGGYSFTLLTASSYMLQMGLAAIFLYAAVIFFSILSKDVIKPIIASIIFLIILSLPRFVEFLSSLYLYRYMTGFDIFIGNGVHYISMLVLTILTTAIFTLAWQIFKKKDF